MIKVYLNDENNYVCEIWGASTKHPDSIFHMEDFKVASWVDKNNPEDMKLQVFQWLLECASRMIFPPHAEDLAQYAFDNWRVWRK